MADKYLKLANGIITASNDSPSIMVYRGDISAYDFTTASFTRDGIWRTLDLSSIVPAGAKWVMFNVDMAGSLAALAGFDKPGNTGHYNAIYCMIQNPGATLDTRVLIPCSDSRTISYKIQSGVSAINLAIMGWILE